MSHIALDDTLRTGIELIDDQHASLIEIYNLLDDAYHSGSANRKMGEILARLLRYAQMHFEAEEELMRRFDYEGLEEHAAEHAELVDQLRRFVLRFTKKEERISTEMLAFVSNWITHHIQESDGRFAPMIREALQADPEPADA